MSPNLELETLQIKGKVEISALLRWKVYETSYFSGVEGFAGKWWLFSVTWDNISGMRHPLGPYKAETRLPGGPTYIKHFQTIEEGKQACQKMWEYWLSKTNLPRRPKPVLKQHRPKPKLKRPTLRLPLNPTVPALLGEMQSRIYMCLLSIAWAFDMAGVDPQKASATLQTFQKILPGNSRHEVLRSLKGLVSKGLLKEDKTGWTFNEQEYQRLLEERGLEVLAGLGKP